MPLIKVVIIEDEPATARNLKFLLESSGKDIHVVSMLSSVADSINWFSSKENEYDLIFMDIRLNDGVSFDIFEKVTLSKPVIFVTAYNDYALQAFKKNGIDYILKPFDETELTAAIEKYEMLKTTSSTSEQQLKKLSDINKAGNYKQSFLVQFRDKLIPLSTDDIAWFYTKDETVYVSTLENKKYIVDFTLEQLQQQLDPQFFFRANRQFIIHRKGINEIDFYFNGRLLIHVSPEPDEKIVVSKARVPEFKGWMNE